MNEWMINNLFLNILLAFNHIIEIIQSNSKIFNNGKYFIVIFVVWVWKLPNFLMFEINEMKISVKVFNVRITALD